MRLDELTAGLASANASDESEAGARVAITGLAYDSRTVRPGDLFFCVPGFQSDGHRFAAQALERGAAALVVERRQGLPVPEVLVSSAREAMAPIAAHLYAGAGFSTRGGVRPGSPAATEGFSQSGRLLFRGTADRPPPPGPAAAPPRACVINVADPYGRRLAPELDGAITFAVEAPADF